MEGVRFLGSIHDVPAGQWNALVGRYGGSVFHRHEWLAAVEDADLVRVVPRHALVADARGEPVAAAPLLHTTFCPKLEMFLSRYLDAGLDGVPMLVGHSMYAQSSEVLGEPEHAAAVLDAICRGATEAPAVFLPLIPGDTSLLKEVQARGWATGLLSCTNLLPVEWASYEEYLAWLPSSRRRNIRKAEARSEAAGVSCRVRRGSGDVATPARLIRSTAEHHGSPLFFDEPFLRAVLEHMGEAAVVFTVYGRGRPVLACLALDAGGELAPWCIGLEYDTLGTFGHYNYLYTQLIRYAIDNRRSVVNFGRSTYYIKRKYGCRLRPVYAAATGTPALRPALEGWIGRIDTYARQELAGLGLPQPPAVEHTWERSAS